MLFRGYFFPGVGEQLNVVPEEKLAGVVRVPSESHDIQDMMISKREREELKKPHL